MKILNECFVIYSSDATLNFQHNDSSLQFTWSFRNYSNLLFKKHLLF